jgi:hypothetical protein
VIMAKRGERILGGYAGHDEEMNTESSPVIY